MVLSVPVIALGATLGTATSILALCGFTYLCKCRQPRKGLSGKDQDMDSENAKPSTLQPVQQFSFKKTTEPIQPRTLLMFPNVYGPKPVMTAPEMINYVDYALKSTEEPTRGKDEVQDQNRMKIQVNEELFVLPQNAMHGSMIGDQDAGCDCYILGTLVSKSGTTGAQTVLKKKVHHIIWEEALLFPLAEEEVLEGMLTLTLRNCDRFSRHSIVGEIKLSLANVGEPFRMAQWEKLKTPEKEPDAGYGEILLSISYLPAANRLLVVLIKAKNLHFKQLKDLLGKDVSVKVILKHQSLKLKKQTKHAKHKINPVWNEMIMFEVPQELLHTSSVVLEMLSQDGLGQSQSLGKCSLGLHATGTERNHWEEMLRNPRRQIAMWHQLHM
ncbi:synaptotagmin-13 isoform X2 [Lepidochelys kempii]|uniref:synaptotagmin-13 isoform X2 n=1 Tax=Lepidochelys kempii TaxID=8472 RepID=UPI003C6F95C2